MHLLHHLYLVFTHPFAVTGMYASAQFWQGPSSSEIRSRKNRNFQRERTNDVARRRRRWRPLADFFLKCLLFHRIFIDQMNCRSSHIILHLSREASDTKTPTTNQARRR